MVGAIQGHEPRAWDHGGEATAFLERYDRIASRVKDKGWDCEMRQPILDIDFAESFHESHGIFGGSRHPLEIVEPAHLLRRGARDESRGEDLTVGRVVAAPSFPNESHERPIFLFLLGGTSSAPAPSVGPVEDQVACSLRMASGKLDSYGATLRNPEEDELL